MTKPLAPTNPATRMAATELQALAASALEAVGIPGEDARAAAEILVFADLVGIHTHGLARLSPYIARLRDGAFNPRPAIRIRRRGATGIVDGDNGLGPVVGRAGIRLAIEIARDNGVGYVGCRDSQHFGALAPYIMTAAESGMVVVLGTTAFPTMAPWGGREVKLGNNPLGIGAPRPGRFPFIFDIALSIVARGKIRQAHERGEAIPPGWALDREGEPTTDPLEALKGFVLPVGGHKGYGLALLVDILAATLIGGIASHGVRSLFQQKDKPQKVGHFFIAIDPEHTIGKEAFDAGLAELEAAMRSTAPFDPSRPVILPGDIEGALYAERMRDGIPLDPQLLDQIERLARGERVAETAAF
ncbi:MAG: Ldh family oxidoreductase [Rhizobiales bacterium]|nr:Ldh family oxidoreductase [Hyphomicrobiales bacterium]